MEQQFGEAQVVPRDIREENVTKVELQPSTRIQPRAMEIDMSVSIETRRCATIKDRATLLDKGILILNPNGFMWIQTKQNYNKHVERMENWKDINEEEECASKARLVTLMNWEASMLNIMFEFVNTFVTKDTNIYLGMKTRCMSL